MHMLRMLTERSRYRKIPGESALAGNPGRIRALFPGEAIFAGISARICALFPGEAPLAG
ncbi:hypothetical protein C8U37_10662 [Trichococcus patagoniensis]|uniref:Uncharacterized protein n=1 Tax=Trichococcus patagoniensis TaxID=382641 RepID=A0A2T5IM79_9LACT|nr:hypothetical protein C8U37_10662 [Trichococcus patagoniensis]